MGSTPSSDERALMVSASAPSRSMSAMACCAMREQERGRRREFCLRMGMESGETSRKRGSRVEPGHPYIVHLRCKVGQGSEGRSSNSERHSAFGTGDWGMGREF